MDKILRFEAWTSKMNETKNLGSKSFPKEDLKDNFKEWKDDHEDQADELYDKLKDRHPDADKDELKQLAKDWVGDKEEKEKAKEKEETEKVKESVLLEEGKIKEIDILSQEANSKEEFEAALKEYVKKIGKPELAEDKDFIEAMTADWKPSTKED